MLGFRSIPHMLLRGVSSARVSPVVVSGDKAVFTHDKASGAAIDQTQDQSGLAKAICNTFVGF